MRLQVNGTQVDAEVATLAELLTAQGYGDAKVATAVNGNFVPASLRSDLALADGDNVEVLAPMQGG